jgi:hypothetical protein
VITLLTDFGDTDTYVGVMKGVILGINAGVHIVDLTHRVPPQQLVIGALALRSAVEFFPKGTIHVAVVDPGVGSQRQPILIETPKAVLVGPDNGLLVPAADRLGRVSLRQLENDRYFRRPVSQTFHGRDVFAPVAAHLSRGLAPAEVGPVLDTVVELPLRAPRSSPGRIDAEVVYVDHFGNLLTNIDADLLNDFRGAALSVSIGTRLVGNLVTAYAAVPEGSLLAIVGSWGVLEIAARNGNAAKMLAAAPGMPVTVALD